MAYDRKYGKVTTEFGTIGEDEPVVVFRAQDFTLPAVLLNAIKEACFMKSPSRHLTILFKTRELIIEWQKSNPEKVKIPSSESSKERLPE